LWYLSILVWMLNSRAVLLCLFYQVHWLLYRWVDWVAIFNSKGTVEIVLWAWVTRLNFTWLLIVYWFNWIHVVLFVISVKWQAVASFVMYFLDLKYGHYWFFKWFYFLWVLWTCTYFWIDFDLWSWVLGQLLDFIPLCCGLRWIHLRFFEAMTCRALLNYVGFLQFLSSFCSLSRSCLWRRVWRFRRLVLGWWFFNGLCFTEAGTCYFFEL
jgi:hypothetical protein